VTTTRAKKSAVKKKLAAKPTVTNKLAAKPAVTNKLAAKPAVTKTKRATVCVIGVWHLGAVNAVGFAEKGYRVIGVELDPKKARRLQQGTPPLFEPGLKELFEKHLKTGQLSFSSDPSVAKDADYVVIAYDSPVNERDEVDITPVTQAAQLVAPFLGATTPIIVTSQVPLGSCEKIEADVRAANPSWASGLVYTPENLRLGSAIPRFLDPDMLVLGASDPRAAQAALALYLPFQTEKLAMDLRSAEMVKHALNVFLATSITFINEIANLADRLGADAVAVGQALRLDKRIGKSALMTPGLGFSGGTLARDVTQLGRFASDLSYRAKLLEAIVAVNEGTFDEIVIRLAAKLGTLAGKKIGILGLTYKAGTSTVRRSPAIKIMGKLSEAGATCTGYDPMASAEELSEYSQLVKRAKSVRELAKGADALVLVTEWPEFRELPFAEIAKLMKRPLLVDSKNYLDPEKIAQAGLDYQGFGRSARAKAVSK
jgi:UDPglucose 6-dehydrogenase